MWSQVLDPGHNPGAVPETNNPRGTFIQLDPPEQSMTKAFTPHGLLSAGLQDKEDRSAKRQEELARETGASLINVPNKPPPPQTGLLGAITAHERDRKREGGVGAALTEREREKRLAEERQRKLDELQRQQLEQMQQGGSLYGQQLAGFNPMMNPMMMGMNPMVPNFMGYPGMMPSFGNHQHMFAAQQAAHAYQQAMLSLSQAGSQIGGEGGTPAPMSLMMTGAGMAPSPAPINPMMTGGGMGGASPAPLNPMMTGGGMGAFDPRLSMMSMSMMNPMAMGMGMGNPGMGMSNPGMGMNNPGMGMSNPGMGMNNPGMGMSNPGMGMGMNNPGMVGAPMGAPMGMGLPMNTGAGFDPRMSQFDAGLQVSNSNLIQPGRAGSTLGLDPSPGAGDGARRSASASPRPPQ
jgi:CCR4-NOT transcriptional complex subunit CAF120